MSGPLADVLDDLAREIGPGDLPPGLAETARSAGRRRRIRRRVAQAGAATLALGVLALAVLPGGGHPVTLPSGPNGTVGPVGHPQRIGSWWVRNLPDRGGPIAGVAFGTRDSSPGAGAWYAVEPDGNVRRLPVEGDFLTTTLPSISSDGRRIGYADVLTGRYAIRDLETGRVTTFPKVGADPGGAGSLSEPWTASSQMPAYWSPDGTRVAVPVRSTAQTEQALLLGVAGTTTVVPLRVGQTLAGWLSADELLTLQGSDATGSGSTATRPLSIQPVAVGASGGQRALPPLRPDRPLPEIGVDQWSPSLSPDHQSLALHLGYQVDAPGGSGPEVLTFALATGVQTGSAGGAGAGSVEDGTVSTVGGGGLEQGSKHLEWQDRRLVGVLASTSSFALTGNLSPLDPVVVTDPGLHLTWLDLADSALAGPTHPSIWGTSTSWLSWQWPSLVVGLLAVALVAGLSRVALRTARRQGRTPADRTPADRTPADRTPAGRTRAAGPRRAWRWRPPPRR